MSKLKSFMIPMMAMAAVVSAVPAAASAQHYRPAPAYAAGLHAFEARKDNLERRIDRAVSMRRLDVRDSRALKQELRDISLMQRDFARGGLNRQERQRLEQRYDRVEQRLEREMRQDRRDDRRRR